MSRIQEKKLPPLAESEIRIHYSKSGLSQRDADELLRELQGGQHNTKALSMDQIIRIAVNGRRRRDEMEAQAARLDELRSLDAEITGAMSAGCFSECSRLTDGELKEVDARLQDGR